MRYFWELTKQELGKLLYNKKMWIVIGTLLLLNFSSLMYTEYQSAKDIPFRVYRHVNKALKNMSDTEKSQYIDREYERAEAYDVITLAESLRGNPQMQFYRESILEENRELYEKYIDEYKEEVKLSEEREVNQNYSIWKEIKEEKEEVEQYPLLLEEIQSKADNLNQISIFRESVDEFSKRSIEQTAHIYKGMENTSVSYQLSKGTTCFTRLNITDIFMLLFVLSLSCIVLLEEKQKNLYCLIKSTKNGRVKTMFAKMAVSFAALATMCILMYGMNLLYYGCRVGYGNLQASLQSLKPFLYSVLPVSIGEYLILFLGCKLLVWLIALWLLFLLGIFAKSYASVFTETLMLAGGSYIAWNYIKIGFVLELWHYENLVGWLNVNEIWKTYKVIKWGGKLVDLQKLNISVWLFLLLLLSVLLVIIFEKKKDTNRRGTIRGIRWLGNIGGIRRRFKEIQEKNIAGTGNRHLVQSNRLYPFECYKLWILEHLYLFVILLIFFCGYSYNHFHKHISYQENAYKNYMKALEGELTEEKERWILAEQRKYEQAQLKLDEIQEKVENGSIQRQDGVQLQEPYEEILQLEATFQRVADRYEYVKEHPGTWFVYDSGYKKMFRIQKFSFLESDILLVVMLILCGTPLFIMEYQTGMITVIRATPKGQLATAVRKIGTCMFASVVICSIIIGYEMGKIGRDYGLDGMNASITSLPYFERLPESISIGGYMVIMNLVRILVALCILLCILLLSLLIKNNLWTMLASGGILLIPMLLLLWRVEAFEALSVVPALYITQGIGNKSMAWQSFVAAALGIFSFVEILHIYIHGTKTRKAIYFRQKFAELRNGGKHV